MPINEGQPQGTIPEYSRVKLASFLTSPNCQNLLNGIILRTRKSGFEQALTIFANAESGALSAKESKSSSQSWIERGFSEHIEKGLRPLVVVHTHAAETEVDLEGRYKYFEGTYFLPSPEDMLTPHVSNENGRQVFDLTEAMIVTTSTPRVWIWQVPNNSIQKLASYTVNDYLKDISRDITESDILELVKELQEVNLKLYYGNLDAENSARSFTDAYSFHGFHAGYSY